MNQTTLAYCLQIIAESFPGRWKPTKQTTQVWSRMLCDLDDGYAKAAVFQLCGSCEFPPTISQIREMAANLFDGDVSPPSAWEAWEGVLSGSNPNGLAARALQCIGGMYAVKHTESPGVERSNFIKAYSEFLETERRRRLAIPEVLRLAESNRPEITQVDRQIEEREEITPPTKEELSDLLAGLTVKV